MTRGFLTVVYAEYRGLIMKIAVVLKLFALILRT